MSITTERMTAEELFMMPDDDFRYDLIRGELRKMSPAGSRHGAMAARLTGALVQHVEANNLGEVFGAETGFKLASNPDTVLGPDLSFVVIDRIPAEGIPIAYWPGAPDLAVEVVSPGNTRKEIEEKVNEYLAGGARLVWVINPKQRTVVVHRPSSVPRKLTENDMLDGEEVVPGFQYAILRLFTERRGQ